MYRNQPKAPPEMLQCGREIRRLVKLPPQSAQPGGSGGWGGWGWGVEEFINRVAPPLPYQPSPLVCLSGCMRGASAFTLPPSSSQLLPLCQSPLLPLFLVLGVLFWSHLYIFPTYLGCYFSFSPWPQAKETFWNVLRPLMWDLQVSITNVLWATVHPKLTFLALRYSKIG